MRTPQLQPNPPAEPAYQGALACRMQPHATARCANRRHPEAPGLPRVSIRACSAASLAPQMAPPPVRYSTAGSSSLPAVITPINESPPLADSTLVTCRSTKMVRPSRWRASTFCCFSPRIYEQREGRIWTCLIASRRV